MTLNNALHDFKSVLRIPLWNGIVLALLHRPYRLYKVDDAEDLFPYGEEPITNCEWVSTKKSEIKIRSGDIGMMWGCSMMTSIESKWTIKIWRIYPSQCINS